MIQKLQYFIGSCTDPHRNLALEEYLTDTVGADTCILYLWQNKHTVVIGRNQNAWQECRTTELEHDGGTLARRLSGGGAVYHDLGNLNFTFSLHTQDYDLRRQQSVIVEACRSLGIPAEISGRNDILTNGCKFSGNSFYSHAGCSFHNGTLLVNVDMANLGKYLTPSKTKLESKGVASVRSRVINVTELKPDLTIDGMAQAMVKALGAGERARHALAVHPVVAVEALVAAFDLGGVEVLFVKFLRLETVDGLKRLDHGLCHAVDREIRL